LHRRPRRRGPSRQRPRGVARPAHPHLWPPRKRRKPRPPRDPPLPRLPRHQARLTPTTQSHKREHNPKGSPERKLVVESSRAPPPPKTIREAREENGAARSRKPRRSGETIRQPSAGLPPQDADSTRSSEPLAPMQSPPLAPLPPRSSPPLQLPPAHSRRQRFRL